ncbi:MAG: hypothetical protein M0R70_01110 [Nitrospirae bacterium]|nr:hypothetical protein [Nitrospirota bacterium]
MKRLLLYFCIILLPSVCFAEDIYISQIAQGADSGSNCSNSHSLTWFNTSGNWGGSGTDGKISPGDTAHLCGTFTSTATVQGSGVAGNVIIILFESGAKFSKAAWGDSTSSAIYSSGKSYLVIDGGTNGIIESTDNGDSMSGKGISQIAAGVYLIGASYSEIKNLTVQNMYMHTEGTTGGMTSGGCIWLTDSSNVEVHNNTLNNDYFAIHATSLSSSVSNVNIYSNTISACSTGMVVANNPGRSISAVNIYSNNILMGDNWDNASGDNHVDGIHIWSVYNAADTITGLKIYDNYIHGDVGMTQSTKWSSGYIYMEYDIIDPLIYNNILACESGQCPSLGNIAIKGRTTSPGASSPKVYNNTIIGVDGTGSSGSGIYLGNDSNMTPIIINNIIKYQYMGINDAGGSATITSDSNDFNGNNWVGHKGSYYTTLVNWQALGSDLHSTDANPQLDANYRLTASSPASVTAGGVNLSSLFTIDKDNHVRPSAPVPWSIGAYQYLGRRPTAPPNLR